MTIEERMIGLEQKMGKQDALVIELREALTVQAFIEARHSKQTLDHAEWLGRHQDAIRELDDRILNLVSAMGEFMSRNLG